jgi:hypothetical protein
VYDVEPHVAAALFGQMLRESGVCVVTGAQLEKVDAPNATVASMTDTAGRVWSAAQWVDASYEGDLMAAAGVSFAVGREAAATYNESLAGFTGGNLPQFRSYIDPLAADGSLLPLLGTVPAGRPPAPEPGPPPPTVPFSLSPSLHLRIFLPPDRRVGDADDATSSYTFRLCVTNRTANRVPFVRPAGYNATTYELVRRAFAAARSLDEPAAGSSWKLCGANPTPLPGGAGKHDLNSGCGPVGTDFVGSPLAGAAYATASKGERARIWAAHKAYVQGFLWFLGHTHRIRESV